MNVSEQKEMFLAGMIAKQKDRAEEVGGHTWRTYVETYVPQIFFADLASIMSRLERMLWPVPVPEIDHYKLQDLLIDLGNYASFLHEWSMAETTEERRRQE